MDLQTKRLSDSAEGVLARARGFARKWNHEWLGTEAILMGILSEDNLGQAAIGLLLPDRRFEGLREELNALVPPGPPTVSGELPLTPRAKKAIAEAVSEAMEEGRECAHAGDLLLGILREDGGVAAQLLERWGITSAGVRSKTALFYGAVERDRRAERAESEARAWQDADRRSDEARAYLQKHNAGGLGRNIWHAVLDDAVRLRRRLALLAAEVFVLAKGTPKEEEEGASAADFFVKRELTAAEIEYARKLSGDTGVRANLYAVVERAVDEGVSCGVRYAWKHRDGRPPEGLEEEIRRAVMNALSEVIDWGVPAGG